VIIIGALCAVWGGIVLYFARSLHTSWRDMTRSMRSAGIRNTIPGTEFLASERGLRWMRIAGGAMLAAGVALLAVGAALELL